MAAGVLYLILTVPLTHFVNFIDNRLRTGKPERRNRTSWRHLSARGHRHDGIRFRNLTGKNLHLSFGHNHVLRGIDLHVEKGTTAR